MRRLFAVCTLLVGVATTHVLAQQTIAGRVVDLEGRPVAGLTVVLHGVTQDGGAPIAETVSDDSGGFTITALQAPRDVRLLFMAARWNGQVYLGPALQPGTAISNYVLQVGGTSAEEMLAAQGAPIEDAGARPGYAALLVFLPLAAVVVVLVRSLRGTPGQARRAMLRDLARIEAELASNPEDATRRAERDALRTNLLAGSTPTAA